MSQQGTPTPPRPVDGTPARLPDVTGLAERDGVRLAYAVYGDAPRDGRPTLVLLPTWQIITSRCWKAQIGYLARYFRVVTFDARGSGGSDRPEGAAAYADAECAADVFTVMDATGTDQAVLVALSCGVTWAVTAASQQPERVLGIFGIGPSCGFGITHPDREAFGWEDRLDTTEGWAKYNRHNWLEGDFTDFQRFFMTMLATEPHSTKLFEDLMAWTADCTPQLLTDTTAARLGCDGVTCSSIEPLARRLTCPVTVLHGTDDRVRPHAVGERLVELTGGSLVLVEGGGHVTMARDPVLANRLIREFVERVVPRPTRHTWVRAAKRPRRALYLSSPIGLGHARRDIAVAEQLRKLRPDLRIDWLAQDPVTRALDAAGERVHPASAALAGETAHVEAEATLGDEHDLHAFQAIRRMDEILVNNFMVFDDVVSEEHYDLVIADEAWDVDYFLHENPELKRFSYAWLTDFVGWLPMPDGGEQEAAVAADLNAEMIEQRARFRRLRDRSIFVGDPDDVVPDTFGPGLPGIRSWTEENFSFAGYVTGFDPAGFGDREALRRELGYRPDELVCVVTVGGSGVGEHLLRRVLDAVPATRRRVPELRFVVVAGPRIDPGTLPRHDGVTLAGYVPDLQRHLAACDVAVVQGGLTTCMELTASRRPFVYVPLQHHFEQNFHVRRRLDRYGAGRRLPYPETRDPEALAAAIEAEVRRGPVDYRPVETDGAARAAALLADLV
jgi:pimeloyl-ACP methyl ester carboxylesterase/predicted glycosyltransferase